MDASVCASPVLRTAALFAIGNLVRSTPETIPIFIGEGLLDLLQNDRGADFCYGVHEMAICLSSFVTAGGESVIALLHRPAVVALLSDTVMLAHNPMRSLILTALLRILSFVTDTGEPGELDAVLAGGELFDLTASTAMFEEESDFLLQRLRDFLDALTLPETAPSTTDRRQCTSRSETWVT
jgi:hypothetical protein